MEVNMLGHSNKLLSTLEISNVFSIFVSFTLDPHTQSTLVTVSGILVS